MSSRENWRFCLLLCAAVLSALTTIAREYYVTADGAGRADSTQWAHAGSQKQLQTLLDTVGPGDIISLGSGEYARLPYRKNVLLTVTRRGTADKPLRIRGVDTGAGLPTLIGKWREANLRYHAHSACGIAMAVGVSQVQISHLRIAACMTGMWTEAKHDGIQLTDLAVRRCREGIELRGVHQSRLQDCGVTYTKRGIHFETDCHALQVSGVRVDATGGAQDWATEAYPFGFQIADDATNHAIYCRTAARSTTWQSA